MVIEVKNFSEYQQVFGVNLAWLFDQSFLYLNDLELRTRDDWFARGMNKDGEEVTIEDAELGGVLHAQIVYVHAKVMEAAELLRQAEDEFRRKTRA